MWGFAGGVEGCGPDGSFVCLKGRGAGGKRGGGEREESFMVMVLGDLRSWLVSAFITSSCLECPEGRFFYIKV